jgi:hypothetical protein
MSERTLSLCLVAGLIVLAVFSSTACSDDPQESKPDAQIAADASDAGDGDTSQLDAADGADAGPQGIQRTTPQDGVDPDGHADVDQTLTAGEARVGKISSEDTGFRGIWAHCRTGDFKLYNADIEVCIQSETTNRFEVFSGGMIVDAKRAGDTQAGDTQQEDVLDFVMPLVGLGTTFTTEVNVLRDGSDGGAAVLETVSTDVALAHLVGLTGGALSDPQGIDVITEYRLEPDSDSVEIVSWYINPTDGQRSFFIGDWFGFGDRAQLWTPGRGIGAPGGRYGWLASLADGSSYGWVMPDGSANELGLTGQGLPWAGSRASNVRLNSGQQRTWQRWFVVGDGTLASIQERAAEIRGEDIAGTRRTLTVETDAGEPAVGRGVLATLDDTPIAWGKTDANGEVALSLADGDYDLVVDGWHGGQDFERELSVSEQAHTISIDTPATLSLSVTESASSELLTSRVVISGGTGFSGPAVDGTLDLELAAGTYRIVASHGPEYDAAAVDVTLAAGDSQSQSLELSRGFDTPGWLSGDFHQHMEPSLDSEVHIDQRLLENVALGVEITASTDHEAVSDLRPLISEYGFEDKIASFPGVEISPIETHVGLYPMDYVSDERGRGTLPLAVIDDEGEPQKRSIPDLIALARQLTSDPVVQLNHSRRSTSGLLELVGFDPELGPDAVDDDRFTTDFDTMEIINRFNNACRLFADWSGFLNAGYTFTGLGNSDTHDVSGESGLPRNFLHIDKTPGEVTADDVRQALRSGRVTVGAHAFMDFADGKLPGDVISTNANQGVDFGVRVQTPDWAQATHLITVVNGQAVDLVERDGTTATDHLDFEQTINRSFAQDSWIVFFAYGPNPSGDMSSGKPVVAFTNPIFIDVDGDSDDDGDDWEAPGTIPLTLDSVDEFCN